MTRSQNMDEKLYFKDVFTLGPNFKTNFDVSLTSTSIIYESKSSNAKGVITLDDVIGAKVKSSIGDEVQSIFIHIYSYPLKKRRFSKVPRRHRLETVFCVAGQEPAKAKLEIAQKWVRCIKLLLTQKSDVNNLSDDPPRQRFLVFINPFGGQGNAKTMFEKKVQPMLEEADVEYKLQCTEYPGHAKEIIQNVEMLSKFDCILFCSGDGIINEVINGIMSRDDWQDSIKIPFGHIPCGSGNGLCAAMLHQSGEPFDMISSVFTVLTGEALPLDILKAQTSNSDVQYAFLSIVFGIIAEIDIESEKYRYMGETRFTVMALKKIMQRRVFSGKLWYLPLDNKKTIGHGGTSCNFRDVDHYESFTTASDSHDEHKSYNSYVDENFESSSSSTSHESGKEHILKDGKLDDKNVTNGHLKDGQLSNGMPDDTSSKRTKSDSSQLGKFIEISEKGNEGDDIEHLNLSDGILEDVNLKGVNLGNDDTMNGKTGFQNRLLPHFHEPIPDSWKAIEGDFIGVLFLSTSYIGKGAFCAPEATFGDGVIHCMCFDGSMRRADMFNVVTALESGEHVHVTGVSMLKARAFRLEPTCTSSKVFTIDGECFEFGATQAEIIRGLGRVRCRRPIKEQI